MARHPTDTSSASPSAADAFSADAPPADAADVLVSPALRDRLEQALRTDHIGGGWLLCGPPQIGKATLAYQLARALLSGNTELGQSDNTTDALIRNGAHPDLFVLERETNEKTGRLRNDIGVDAVRRVTAGLHQTSTTGKRVVIVDLADHLRRESANALLKTLEEPPEGTTMLLLSVAPGRLLPTIRSRCRTLTMLPIEDDAMTAFANSAMPEASANVPDLLPEAGGRPGRLLALMAGEGETARELADRFFECVENGSAPQLLSMASAVAGKDADTAWGDTRQLILDRLSRRLREAPEDAAVPSLLSAYETLRDVSGKSTALNSDRQHTILSMALTLRQSMRSQHAR